MTVDEIWIKVKEYYENCGYRDPKTNVRIKFRQRPSDEQIKMLYQKMTQLPRDLEALPDRKLMKFANVVRLLRNQDVDKI